MEPSLNTKKKDLISVIWETWGRHICGKGVVGDFTQKKDLISDIWETWGRHIWGKGVVGDFTYEGLHDSRGVPSSWWTHPQSRPRLDPQPDPQPDPHLDPHLDPHPAAVDLRPLVYSPPIYSPPPYLPRPIWPPHRQDAPPSPSGGVSLGGKMPHRASGERL